MKVVGRDKLDAFCAKHAAARKWIENWLADVETATWITPQDIKNRYPSVSFLAENVVILNVKGNDYRLEALVAYKTALIVIRWIGTHAEYDARNRDR